MKFNEIVHQFQHNVFGNLTTIRSFKDKNKIWFLGAEVQKFIGHSNLTQAIKDANLNFDEFFKFKKLSNPQFFTEVTKQSLVGYGKYSSSITFISESGLYKLILRSNKPEAQKFADWITREILPKLRQAVEEDLVFKNTSVEISRHLDILHQKQESKNINGFNFRTGGVNKAVKYNRNSCLDHSGQTPSE
jgi:prophage antirepressor-like protein